MSSAPPHTAGGGGAGQGLPAVLCWPRPGLSATHSPFIALRWKDPSCATVPPRPAAAPHPSGPAPLRRGYLSSVQRQVEAARYIGIRGR